MLLDGYAPPVIAAMTEIKDRDDLNFLIRCFYEKALIDPEIGFFFTEIAEVDLEVHIPKIVSFWEMLLFRTGSFNGNPYQTHKLLDMKSAIEPHHFQRWFTLFHQCIDAHFVGECAETLKFNAKSIATRMAHALSTARLSSESRVLGTPHSSAKHFQTERWNNEHSKGEESCQHITRNPMKSLI